MLLGVAFGGFCEIPSIPEIVVVGEGKHKKASVERNNPTMSWHTLPLELKQAIVDELDEPYPLAQVDRLSYTVCVGALFKVRIATKTDVGILKAHR